MSSGRCGSNGSMTPFNLFITGSSGGRRHRPSWSSESTCRSKTQGSAGQKRSGQGLEHEDEDPL